MKSKTLLDSVVFQLTPTRTRCDLVIIANGKTEKIASGLLDPFLSHLKTAQEQIGKGGYSVILEPNDRSDAAWFTKGTVERFVRFVNTPEILERVYTIESEILQIEKAISIHANSETGLHTVEDLPMKSEESVEGRKPATGDDDEEKAIVLYQPDNHQQEEDGSTMQEKNSKVQLVQILQTRKTALQKEQGMAFARAVAASFDIDNISSLLSFAESFGASRMMDACKRFVYLWKAKNEIGQLVEVEMTDAAVSRLPSMNPSGIMLVSSHEQGDVASANNGILCATGGDVKPRADHQGQPSPQEHIPGQFAPPMFPPWQMHPQANGLPVFQSYSPQGMSYYQNYPASSPYFQPQYSPLDDSTKHVGQRTRHSMDSRNLSADFDTQDMDMDDKDSVSQRPKKIGGKSSRKKSGVVVIRNLNYIASANQGSSDGDPESCSDPGTDNEEENVNFDETRKLKKEGKYSKYNKKEALPAQVGDDGQWQAFQNFLLKDADESSNSGKRNMFAMEGKVQGIKRQTAVGDAASDLKGHNLDENGHGFSEHHDIAGDMTRMRIPTDDKMLSYGQRANSDDMIHRQEKLTDLWDSSLDPVIANNNNRGSSHNIADESSMILRRSGSIDQVVSNGRIAMDMNYELPSVLQMGEGHTAGTTSQSNYEPNDLNLIPDRMMEDGLGSYDPALDYEMQGQVKNAANLRGKEKITPESIERPRKGVKDQKLIAEKRTTAVTRREKVTKLSPPEDARARAERLRAFKADLQKQKKEKEEEQKKRLEALKVERQKRIAARNGANPASSSLPSPQARKQLPKLSPVSQKGSKFSDTEPGSSSPLQRSTLKFVSKIRSDSNKASKSGRLNFGSPVGENRVTRSASSLNIRKEENNDTTPESKATTARIRRLSEPKATAHHISSTTTKSAEVVSRRRMPEGSETKKMPAVANPGKTKSASVPELKLRVSKGSSLSTQKKSTTTELLQKRSNKMISSVTSSTTMSRNNAKISSPSEVKEDTLVEKTVVMLERGKPSKPIKHAFEEKSSVQDMQSGTKSEDDVTVPPPASPIIIKEVDREPANESGVLCTEKVLPNNSNSGTGKSLYQPPYARVSSQEDPCMIKSDYGKALPTGLDMATPSIATTTVHVSDGQREDPLKISEVFSDKYQGKETSKGFRQLFKFGKKNSAPNESNLESSKATLDGSEVEGHTLDATSSEVFTLRNLLTQEESSTSITTPKKSSRSFFLLSPFRSKTREKKVSA